MSIFREWVSRFWGTFFKRRAEHEWEEELRLHVELAAEDARRRGVSPRHGLRAVRLHAGTIPQTMERLRDQRGLPWLEDVAGDFRHSLRVFRRNPAYTAIAVLTLALGIGANSAIFSVVNAVLLRPLPYAEPERLVAVNYLLAGEYLFLRDHVQSVQEIALYRENAGFNLSDVSEAERITGAYVSTNFFSTLGIGPVVGRVFRGNEEQPAENDVIVLSHAVWRQRFGADPRIIGRTITVDSEPREVVGVMPATFNFPSARTQVWIPYAFDRSDAPALWGGPQGGRVVARLAPGASPAQFQAELRTKVPELRKANTVWVFPASWGANREVVLLHDRLVGDVRTRLWIMLCAVGFVLLIACANVANLSLARAAARQREVAIRQALGAGRGRIVRQLLTESVVLALLGGTAGVLLAYWGVHVLASELPADIPRAEGIRVDPWVLGFALIASVLTGLAFGAVPAIRSSRSSVQASLKTHDRGSGASFGRTASLLVVGEVAAAVLLVICAGLLIRSFAELVRVDPGFRTEHVITARITPPDARYRDSDRLRVFYHAVLDGVAALPRVQRVEAVSHLPLVGGTAGFAFEVEDMPYVPGTGAPTTGDRRVTPGYLDAMGIPLLQGRMLADADGGHTPRVAVINDAMARRHWPGTDPVGKRFKEVWLDEWTTIVGVVGDVKYDGLASAIEPDVYRPFLQRPARDMWLVIRSLDDATAVGASVREALASVDPTVPVSDVRTLDQILSSAVATSRFTALLLGGFGAVALMLAAVGIYGVLSYAVVRRAREIGLRMALGARRFDILRLVLGHALILAGVGTLAGLAAALAATRALEALLFAVSRTDIVTFAAVPVVLIIVALVAAYVPASRAIRVDPTVALRVE